MELWMNTNKEILEEITIDSLLNFFKKETTQVIEIFGGLVFTLEGKKIQRKKNYKISNKTFEKLKEEVYTIKPIRTVCGHSSDEYWLIYNDNTEVILSIDDTKKQKFLYRRF